MLGHQAAHAFTLGAQHQDHRPAVQRHGEVAFRISRGMKIAQLVIARHETVELSEVGELPASERGAGGFGSTGLHAANKRTA